jgi:hypothetical protein
MRAPSAATQRASIISFSESCMSTPQIPAADRAEAPTADPLLPIWITAVAVAVLATRTATRLAPRSVS